MKQIKINTDSKNYSVLVGSEILNQENFKEFSEREILLVIDSNIDLKVKNNVKERLERISSKFAEITLDASEENKTYTTLANVVYVLFSSLASNVISANLEDILSSLSLTLFFTFKSIFESITRSISLSENSLKFSWLRISEPTKTE